MTGIWTDLPPGRAICLLGADAEAIATCADPLPEDAPAMVTVVPHAEPLTAKVVDAMLCQLEEVAIELFPLWLPAAAGIAGPGGAAIPAVRAIAKEVASASDFFGPLLADLAVSALRGRSGGLRRFSAEIRALQLIRVIKASYARSNAAIVVPLPQDLSAECEEALVSACEWIAQHCQAGVWMLGPLLARDRIASVKVQLPGHLKIGLKDEALASHSAPVGSAVVYPAVAGSPHPASAAEQKLERAMLKRAWAVGRVWNQSYQSHPLVNPVRLDLWWRDERCVVEIDGPDHRGKWKFAEDRRRDVMLHNDGLAVLRFTNGQILDDLNAVLAAIEQFIQTRRKMQLELSNHG